MKSLHPLAVTLISLLLAASAWSENKPLKALLIAGGCCHDYAGQTKALSQGIQQRANVQVDVYWTDDKSTNPPFPLFENPDWAKGYDVIIHDECAAGNKDLGTMMRILKAHETVPAVHLHCAMHSFRNGTDKWFRHLGLGSNSHGPQVPIEITFVDTEHPITEPLEDWVTDKEELYNNTEIFDAHPLALGKQIVNGKPVSAVVAWTNEKQGARSFSTTIGHNTSTVADPRYLDLVTRGLLWACDKLGPDHLKAFGGKNKVTFISKQEQAAAKAKQKLSAIPDGATIVKVTAQSEETNKGNLIWHAIDGDKNTRWCAANGSKPQWVQLEFETPQELTDIHLTWESSNNAYAHKIEAEIGQDKKRVLLVDATANQKPGDSRHKLGAKAVKRLIITCTGTSQGGWASIREINLSGPGIKSIFPKIDPAQAAAIEAEKKYKNQGNVPPKVVQLSAEEEAAILKEVKVPEGLDVSLFAPAATANYPVYVAAAPNGDVYVSSDGNGSLGRNPHRGRVLRLRDTDRDGRADQVTEFVKDIDSPRGLVWDHDRLYLIHPPHISVFFDRDGDGVSEESQKLIDGIAFGFKDRPADHTTNGLDMGIDGWLYIAGGDFGFLEATGTDGRKLQHRGGGVIRFRPDGSGLELFSTGTRNILGTPISPLLDLFARDNTNDGGGWNVRFHHFTGLEDHGYPRMYINFDDEIVQPLDDYGGGSGCGSTYLSEPGFPEAWNHAPMTCDWGTGALWKHTVERKGATFIETEKPQKFISMPRPTDAAVDGLSGVYQASWKGATFNWAGANVGYIVRVSPEGYTPSPLPDFTKLSDTELIKALASPSQVRTMAAQRELLRRPPNQATTGALYGFAGDNGNSLESRVAALYAITLRDPGADLSRLANSPDLLPFVMRALGDMEGDAQAILATGLKSQDPRTRLEAIVAATRRGLKPLAAGIATSLGHADPVIAHTAFRGLGMLGESDPCFAILDASSSTPAERLGAAQALMRMHQPGVVDGLIARLGKEKRPDVRQNLLAALCRLANHEGEWKGASWGTRPDTRGPYYQPEAWGESSKVLAALSGILADAEGDEAAFLIREMQRNRIESDDALGKILKLAAGDPSLVPEAVAQIDKAGSAPAAAIPILLAAAKDPQSKTTTLVQAIRALSKSDDAGALPAMLAGLIHLHAQKGANKDHAAGRSAFLKAPKLENHHQALTDLADQKGASPEATWARAGVLELASRTSGSPESRQMTQQWIDSKWLTGAGKVRLMAAATLSGNRYLDQKILAALGDPEPEVKVSATAAAKALKLDPNKRDTTPKIATLKPADALAAVIKTKGDVSLGEQVFARATCAACHTTNQDEPQKGPYLGNIAQTYKRPALATSILDPNQSIAQGFTSNVITTKDGKVVMGFVTNEGDDRVTVRDISAKEHTFKKADITKRDTVPTSLMPPGLMANFTVHETASLLDYLESLSKK